MLKYSGAFAHQVLTGGDAAIQAAIDAAGLKQTMPSGNLGALTRALFDSIVSTAIAVIDLGRGHVTVFKHSANNVTRINTALGGTPSVRLRPLDIVRSPAWLVLDGAGGNVGASIVSYDPGVDATDPENPVPIPDSRTAIQIALADEFAPSQSMASGSSLVDRVLSVIDAENLEGFIVVNEQDALGEVRLFSMNDTSSVTSFQSAAGVAGLDAGGFIGVYAVPAVVAASSSGRIW